MILPNGEVLVAGVPAALEGWPDAPLYAWDYDAFLDQAKSALQRRRDGYPKLIEKGAMDAGDAAEDIAAWELIEAEWQWIETGTGQLPPPASLDQRLAAIDLALERVGTELRRGNRAHDVFRQAHLLQAMRWHLERIEDGVPAVHRYARLTLELRAELLGERQTS